MKNVLLTFAAAVCLVSCTAALSPEKDSRVSMTVGIKPSGTLTRSTVAGSLEENRISSIQVFVFKENQGAYIFEASAKAEATSVDVTVTTGVKDILMLVNEPEDLTGVTSRADLLARVSSLADNSPSALLMMGQATSTISTSEHVVEIPVNRLASRVRVNKITNKLRNGYAAKNVKVARVFLTGVSASAPYSPTGTPSGFYATEGIGSQLDLNGTAVSSASEKAAVNSLIYKNVSSAVIADGASYSTDIPLYGYPNDASVTKTVLVVEMEIDGKYFTYPIELPAMARNCTCEVTELEICSIGNCSDGDDELDPGENEPISFTDATFKVSVQPWTIVPIANTDDGKYVI